MLALPKCRHCTRKWMPKLGVVATQAFCARCRKERRAIAKNQLELKVISERDLDGKFLLPRAMRKHRKLHN